MEEFLELLKRGSIEELEIARNREVSARPALPDEAIGVDMAVQTEEEENREADPEGGLGSHKEENGPRMTTPVEDEAYKAYSVGRGWENQRCKMGTEF